MTSFVKQHLHGGPPESIDAEALKKEVEELRQKNKELQEQVAQLQTAVCLVPRQLVCVLLHLSMSHFLVGVNYMHYRNHTSCMKHFRETQKLYGGYDTLLFPTLFPSQLAKYESDGQEVGDCMSQATL